MPSVPQSTLTGHGHSDRQLRSSPAGSFVLVQHGHFLWALRGSQVAWMPPPPSWEKWWRGLGLTALCPERPPSGWYPAHLVGSALAHRRGPSKQALKRGR